MSTPPVAGPPVPILRSFDEAKAKEFWVDFLGFQVDWEFRFEPGTPLYMQLSLGDCVIHVSEMHGDATPGSAMRVRVPDAKAVSEALLAKAYPFARPGWEDQPWGDRECRVGDPFGNRIVFWSPVPG